MNGYFRLLLQGLGAALLAACAGATPTPKSTPTSSGQPKAEIEVPRTVVTPERTTDVSELMRDGYDLARAQKWGEAAAVFEQVYALEPDGPASDDALWCAADAHDRANQLEQALVRYELIAKRRPDTDHGRNAMVYSTRLLLFLGRFEDAGLYAERLLKEPTRLPDNYRVAIFGARALALLQRGEEQQASYFIEKGRELIDADRFDAPGAVPRDLAQLYYALGEYRRLRAERVVFDPLPPNFGAVLEERCQLLLDAQSAYADTMRAMDARWSAMAGFRTAELYQRLHQDLLVVKSPPSADTERKRALFDGAVRTRYSILLTKAKTMAEHTIAMAERTGEHSEWVERSRQALKSIDERIADENAALAKLAPYTRQDFEAYLAEMEAAATAAASGPNKGGKAGPGKPASQPAGKPSGTPKASPSPSPRP